MSAKTAPIRATTQEFLEIEDIIDDLVILAGGSVALVIETTAVNFGLLSEEEQDALIYAYAAFLNSLSFPVQIVISSRKMDVSSYLDLIAGAEQKQSNPKLKNQIRKYYQFILSIVKENKVLEKKFHIVIPFYSLEMGVKSTLSLAKQRQKKLPFAKDYILSRAKTALYPKRDHLLRQLNRIGLKGEQLTTQRLVELFYIFYNPGQSDAQKTAESAAYQTVLVSGEKQ